MLTITNIEGMMKEYKAPCWKLWKKDHEYASADSMGSNMPIILKNLNKEEGDVEDLVTAKVLDNSIEALRAAVKHFRDSDKVIFKISLMPHSTASGTKVIGPLEFKLSEEKGREQGALSAEAEYSHLEKRFTGLWEVERQRNGLELDKRDFKHYQEREKEKLERYKEELEKKEASLEGLKKQYESNVEASKEALDYHVGKLFSTFVKPPKDAKGLGQVEAGTVKQEPLTEQEVLINSICQNILDNVKEPNEVRVIGIVVQKFIANPGDPLFEHYRKNIKQQQDGANKT